MNDRSSWLLALATANLVVLLAGAWVIDRRLTSVEDRTEHRLASLERDRPGRPPAPAKDGPTGDSPAGMDEAAGGDSLREQMAKLSNDAYDYYSEVKSDLYEIRQGLVRLQAGMKRVAAAVGKPGQPGGAWGLAPAGDPLPPETIAAYRRDAEAMGVHVVEGRVEVRGFLNMSPDRSYPIEFFVTRWPESGHETLIHVTGKWDLDPAAGSEQLRGLVTALYKGLVAAGFQPGEPSGYLPGPDPKKPVWVAPKGDTVYVGVRYRHHGVVHVARASDWVVDPDGEGPAVLPEDAFRFTGGLRTEDMRTGDDMLSAEMSGKAVSVYQDPNTLVEIALSSNVHNDYQYNFQRIPRPEAILVLGEAKDAVRLFARVDRKAGTLTIDRLERADAPATPSAPPVLLVSKRDGAAADGDDADREPPVEVPFEPSKDAPGAWVVRHDELQNRHGFGGQLKIRVVVDGKPLVTTGSEPLYLDLILSKTPVETSGDGAKPLQPVHFDEPPAKGTGAHAGDVPPPPPPPTPAPGAMDGKDGK